MQSKFENRKKSVDYLNLKLILALLFEHRHSTSLPSVLGPDFHTRTLSLFQYSKCFIQKKLFKL